MLARALVGGRGQDPLSNGRFLTALSPWGSTGTPTTIEWATGRAHIVGDSANDGIALAVALRLGVAYRLSFDYQVVSGAVNVLKTGMTSITNLSGSGSYVLDFVETDGTSRSLRWVTAAAGEFYLDSVRLFHPFF